MISVQVQILQPNTLLYILFIHFWRKVITPFTSIHMYIFFVTWYVRFSYSELKVIKYILHVFLQNQIFIYLKFCKMTLTNQDLSVLASSIAIFKVHSWNYSFNIIWDVRFNLYEKKLSIDLFKISLLQKLTFQH